MNRIGDAIHRFFGNSPKENQKSQNSNPAENPPAPPSPVQENKPPAVVQEPIFQEPVHENQINVQPQDENSGAGSAVQNTPAPAEQQNSNPTKTLITHSTDAGQRNGFLINPTSLENSVSTSTSWLSLEPLAVSTAVTSSSSIASSSHSVTPIISTSINQNTSSDHWHWQTPVMIGLLVITVIVANFIAYLYYKKYQLKKSGAVKESPDVEKSSFPPARNDFEELFSKNSRDDEKWDITNMPNPDLVDQSPWPGFFDQQKTPSVELNWELEDPTLKPLNLDEIKASGERQSGEETLIEKQQDHELIEDGNEQTELPTEQRMEQTASPGLKIEQDLLTEESNRIVSTLFNAHIEEDSEPTQNLSLTPQ